MARTHQNSAPVPALATNQNDRAEARLDYGSRISESQVDFMLPYINRVNSSTCRDLRLSYRKDNTPKPYPVPDGSVAL